MKARIKKTGEIVNLASYAKITLCQCDSWGNPIELNPEDVELIDDATESSVNWERVRIDAAIAAMGKTLDMITHDYQSYHNIVTEGFSGKKKKTFPNEIAEFSVSCADALVERLKNKD